MADWLERAARLRLELSQRRAHPFLSVEGAVKFSLLRLARGLFLAALPPSLGLAHATKRPGGAAAVSAA